MTLEKVKSRKFSAVASASLLNLVNATTGMGIDWKITLGILAASVAYAFIEGQIDIARMKYAAVDKKTSR